MWSWRSTIQGINGCSRTPRQVGTPGRFSVVDIFSIFFPFDGQVLVVVVCDRCDNKRTDAPMEWHIPNFKSLQTDILNASMISCWCLTHSLDLFDNRVGFISVSRKSYSCLPLVIVQGCNRRFLGVGNANCQCSEEAAKVFMGDFSCKDPVVNV